ncbi:MAG TPA: hypothetical protein VKR06_01325, partial [Ktedonosporobacter sp.]|nr:hypothetical protein [Ktedonosporobacter sp.]
MMQIQQQKRPPGQGGSQKALMKSLLVSLTFLLSGLFALPALLLGVLLWVRAVTLQDAREWMRGSIAAAVFGLVVYGLWLWLSDPFPWLWSIFASDLVAHLWGAMGRDVLLLWLFHLLLFPALGVLLSVLVPCFPSLPVKGGDKARLKGEASQDYEHHEREEQALVVQAEQQLSAMLVTKPVAASLEGSSSAAPDVSPLVVPGAQVPYESLGVYLQGELDSLVFGGELCVPPELLELHGVVIGEPKFGKTWTLLRLAVIAKRYKRKVIYLDLKGSRKTAALFLAAMSVLKCRRVKIYPLEAYDGWRGSPKALYNRLMEQIDPQTHPFYRGGVGSSLISLAVHAPAGQPRNSYELLERLSFSWLKKAYGTDVQAMREIRALTP